MDVSVLKFCFCIDLFENKAKKEKIDDFEIVSSTDYFIDVREAEKRPVLHTQPQKKESETTTPIVNEIPFVYW